MNQLDEMIAGYRRFRETGWTRERERWLELAERQDPRVMVLACSDSRVDPSIIFDAPPRRSGLAAEAGKLAP